MMSSAPPFDLLKPEEQTTALVRRGPWSIELRAGELENIRHRGRLVLRSVRGVVRDENWRTVPSTVDRVEGADRVLGSLLVEGRTLDERVRIDWRLEVVTDGDELRVEYRAEAASDFLRNRLGLIVLHSPELAGTSLTVRHPDGAATSTVFPEEISPHQPAVDIRGLDWVVGDDVNGTSCRLDFSGDVFEMEDQRNWTDASYKSYSTPLALPFPAGVRASDVVEQSIVLRCEGGAAPAHRSDHAGTALLELGHRMPGAVIPQLMTMASTDGDAADTGERARWPGVLLVELDPQWGTWAGALERALRDADERPLDVRIVADGVAEAEPLLDALAAHPSQRFARIGLFSRSSHLADPDTAAALVTELDRRGLDVQVIAGTRAHFTELNRGIARLDAWRGPLTFSMTPFMHDTSGHQLVESIEMQREVVRNARRLAGVRPVHVGPITLGARFNAVATTRPPVSDRADLADGYGPANVSGASDPRSGSSSLAAWLLASVEALAVPGVRSLSYLEQWGARSASDLAAVTVLSWIAELRDSPRRTASAAGLVVLAVESARHGRLVVLVGNLTSEPRSLHLPDARAGEVVIGAGRVRRIAWVSGTNVSVDFAEHSRSSSFHAQ
jgi:hypothetical protein